MGTSGLVTLVFTDLVGSTEMAESIGDRAADELRREHFALLREAITDTDGVEVKTIGDAMMASYSTASDAIDGAVAMQQAIELANRTASGPEISMRIGLSAGDATFEDDDWFGRPVVEASRLCAAAEGGQILAAEIVRVLAGNRSDHEIESRGERELKGLPEPITVCEVAWSLPEPTGGDALIADDLPPLPDALSRATGDGFGFVARQDEHESLVMAWKDVMAGNRRLVFVTGEPGVGKTRLTSELAQLAHGQGGVVLWGGCDEDLGIPYQPLTEALGHYAHAVTPETLRAALGPLGGELTRLVPDLASLVPGLEVTEAEDADAERRRLADALADLLATVSDAHPVLLVLDDLHWAGKPTLVLLRQLLRSPRPMRLLVVGTYRDTDLDRRHPLAEMLADLRRAGEVDRIALSGLAADGVAALMESAAGHELDEPARALAEAIHRETEGNPFFVREVLFHLVESGSLVQRDGRWTSDVQPEAMAIPEGVREVIGRRLSRLPEATNDLLAVASVIGREFDLGLLAALHEGGREAVFDDLEPAEEASIIRPSAGRQSSYLFGHALVRSTLYDELSTSRRLRLHRDAGRALEARGDADRHLADLARHFGESAALGEVDRAVDYGRRAGDRAFDDLAFEEAVAHYERALSALDVADDERVETRCDLQIALGSAQVYSWDPAHRDTLLRAVSDARSLDDATRFADAVLALGHLAGARQQNRVDEQHIALVEEALDRLDVADPARRARLLNDLALALMWTPDAARRRELSDEALSIARGLDDRATLAEVLAGRVVLVDTANPHSLDDYVHALDEMIELAEGTSDTLLCSGYLQRSTAVLTSGHRALCEADLAAAGSLVSKLHEPFKALRSKVLDNMLVILDGRLAEAEAAIFEYLGFAEAHGTDLLETAVNAAGSQFFRIRYEQGRLDELRETIEERVEQFPNVPAWRIALASVHAQNDRIELAREHIRFLAADDFAVVPRDGLWILTIAGVARVSADLGELEIAARAHELGVHFTGRLAFAGNSMEQPVDLSLGVAARALGRLDDALGHFDVAIELSERAGAPTFVAVSRYEKARALVERDEPGDRDRAVELATQALSTARDLGLGRVDYLASTFLASL
ncbi:MAG TPA: AAA family ATPase [Acidimicrobiales bacterium]|nr:AAA family ATPase [Acidimicrobiales bacterium]